MLLVADSAVPQGEPAAWTVEWRDKRAQRAERRVAPATPQDEEARAKAAAKRTASRESKVDGGLAALQQWLEDLVRTGFATVSGQSYATFETTAARMVDAQAKGLADRVRTLGWLARSSGSDPDWSQAMLDTAGSTALLLRRLAALVESGATVVVLLALSDDGTPTYDHELAAACAGLGAPAFACTPDLFPDLLAAALKKEDVGAWAGRAGLPVGR